MFDNRVLKFGTAGLILGTVIVSNVKSYLRGRKAMKENMIKTLDDIQETIILEKNTKKTLAEMYMMLEESKRKYSNIS